MKLIIHTDGGARGNPGPAGVGIVLADADSGQIVHQGGYFLGTATNNVAEYQGLLKALHVAADLQPEAIDLRSDSELMVRQLLGQYRVKSADLKPLYAEACRLLKKFSKWSIRHVPRAQNAAADQLANLAMDQKADVSPGQANAPSASTESEPAAIPCWVASISGRARACEAGLSPGGEYTFGPTTPEGFCVHAAAATLRRGPLQWSASRREGSARCEACGVTIQMKRLV